MRMIPMGTGACTPIAGLQQRWMGVLTSTYTSESLATEQHRRYVLNFRYLPKRITSAAAAENKKDKKGKARR